MNKKLLAEVLGTFILSLVVVLSATGDFALPTPLLPALTVSMFVYTIGHISGCHINPAVTIGLWSIGKITREEGMRYIGAQLLGGVLALVFANILSIPTTPPSVAATDSYLFELLGTALLAFGIASVVFDTGKSVVSGIIIGGSLLLGISLSVLGGAAGILNPAVALALKTTDIGYYFVEVVGAIAGFQLYKYLSSKSSSKKR